MELKYLEVKYENFYTKIPYLVFKGKQDGSHMVVSGGMHGNEINGVHHARNFINFLQNKKIEEQIKGQITVFPILNISGFQNVIRYVFEDNADLNRSFGYDKPFTFSQYIANALEENVFKHATFIIDLHDSGGDNELVPHTRLHIADNEQCMSCTRDMALIFGLEVNLEREGETNMLAINMKMKYDIPVLTIECGGGQRIMTEFNEEIFQGLKNHLGYGGLMDMEIKRKENQYFASNRIYYLAPEAGLFSLNFMLGERVTKGQKLGEMYLPQLQRVIDIISPATGIVFSKSENNQCLKEKSIFSILMA